MNPILSVSGNFQRNSNTAAGGGSHLPKNGMVTTSHVNQLADDLTTLLGEWGHNKPISGILVTAYHNRTLAKSNRIGEMFKAVSTDSPNDKIVGARFSNDGNRKHIITYYLQRDVVQKTIKKLRATADVLEHYFDGVATPNNFNLLKDPKNPKKSVENPTLKKIPFGSGTISISKSVFKQLVQDSYYLERFDIGTVDVDSTETSIISLYDVFDSNEKVRDFLKTLQIDIPNSRINHNNLYLRSDEIAKLKSEAPYLIAMTVVDFNELAANDFEDSATLKPSIAIPDPIDEPTVGVIDTLFDEEVYFSNWVKSKTMVDPNIPTSAEDFKHGTAVSSIIVDGPHLNPELDDGIGRLRVRHFGVSKASGFSSFTIVKQIEDIVQSNPDIRVWNLSLGTVMGSPENFISAEGAALDDIQYKFDVIFVVAGTNKVGNAPDKIGAPADSLNSIVVNSVDNNGNVVEYSRKGPVLSFFIKPDVSYFGGGNGTYINVAQKFGVERVQGTSYAAPWIARKLAYLIDYMGFSKEIAKALIIDAATGWKEGTGDPRIGRGIVPQKIEALLETTNDEIKFVVSEVSEQYLTFNYKYPVPVVDGKHPYRAKTTLVYTPKTSRNQGIDYTDTELDVSFGRVKGNTVESIDNNYQVSDDNSHFITESQGRDEFRKWDNVKQLNEKVNSRAKKAYSESYGLKIYSKERLRPRKDSEVRFGAVITLKAIDGMNRYNWFTQTLQARAFVVREINVKTQIELFNEANEEVELD